MKLCIEMVTSSSLFIKKKKKNISVGILRGARNGEGGGGEGRYAVRLHVVKFFMHAHS